MLVVCVADAGNGAVFCMPAFKSHHHTHGRVARILSRGVSDDYSKVIISITYGHWLDIGMRYSVELFIL